jgi:hypothetical protein
MRHFQARPLEAALDVKAFVGLGAIENALVAADLFGNVVERLDDAQTELLALLVLCDSDVFYVADDTEIVDAARRVLLARVAKVASVSSPFSKNLLTTSSPQSVLPCPQSAYSAPCSRPR